jgi:hypothetical protein
MVFLTTYVIYYSTRFASSSHHYGHLHRNVLTQKTRLVRNVTRVKRTSSITSSLIFSRSMIRRIYFQWNVISKLYFCDQWWDLHEYVSVNIYTQKSDATGNIGSNLCLRNCVYGLDVPDMSYKPGAGYYGWFTPARYTYKNYHSNAKYMIKWNIAVHMVRKIQTSDK